jgi:hypothetical protein
MSQQLWIRMANLIFELEKKLAANESPAVKRSFERMKAVLEEAGITMLNPMGENYQETRTDLEASLVSPPKGQLVILDVIKPIVYTHHDQGKALLQKGVVIVGSKA